MGRGYQIIVLNLQIVNGDGRQIELEWLPVEPVVEGDMNAGFGTGVEQAATGRIIADDAREDICRQPVRDGNPVAAIVIGLEKIRCEVVMLVPVGSEVGHRRVM